MTHPRSQPVTTETLWASAIIFGEFYGGFFVFWLALEATVYLGWINQ